MEEIEIKKISEVEWEIPKTGKMLVPGRIFASDDLMDKIKQDKTLSQVRNVAMLPGIIEKSMAMPDAHQGYGFSIGGVAAFDIDKGVISPGGVGYDIGCSVRLLKTNLTLEQVENNKEKITDTIYNATPSGVGVKGKLSLSDKEINEVLEGGAQWAVSQGYGEEQDYLHMEEQGKMQDTDPSIVSQRAKGRGKNQLGTLGAGNHFLEIQRVDEVFDKKAAKAFGLEEKQIVLMIHCGSRGLGHQVASDYIKKMEEEHGFPEQDRELVNAPIKSKLGKEYLQSMNCAINFAFANKQVITHNIRQELKKLFPNFKAEVIYDVCHNVAKFEKHKINNKEKEVLVMRKGATRSFGPDNKQIPKNYQNVGQPILIPGSMGTSSWVLVGTDKAEQASFSSTAHGAGRVKSRTAIKQEFTDKQIQEQLREKGISLKAGSQRGIVEEAPQAYKNVDEVVNVSHKAGIGNLVAKLKPIIVIKG
jgi:tRNA-splicing ligase RtcB (3'-phosphate/5'-hydroxy nucleic acid ligase)